ncbi:MAG: hypothetical protein IJ394_07240 [Bacteroidales bacterium]|nr:hypothetical protein [Bacteroidales bacterium]
METKHLKPLLITALSLIMMGECPAQPKSAGAAFSVSGIRLSYEHYIDSESFIDLSVKAECGDWFFGKGRYPGISASFAWNMIFSRYGSRNGNEIRLFAGPGLNIGWTNDLLRPQGATFGLKGSLGIECEFDRNVTISAGISPVIGTHIVFHDDHLDMRYYRMGLMASVMPEVGVRYTF